MANDLLLQVGLGFDEAQVTRTAQRMAARTGAIIGSSVNANSFRNIDFALGRITGKANEFQKSLEASNARVVAFGASAGAIFALRSAFQKLVDSTIVVEQSLADINALLNLSTADLQEFSSSLFKVANQTGQTFANAAKAATEFSRQGLGVEETLKRTAAALTLSRLSGLGFEEAVSSLTGTLNSFTKEALDAEDVINRLTAVDARYAVSAADLSKALSRVGASASDANVSLNETIALVTAAQQVTARGGSVIGNAFKTIFTRLQRPEVLDDLEAAGVAVRDLQGKALPLISILSNLSVTYDGLAAAQKSFVAETVGGVYQINVLKAIMNDLGSGTSIVQGALDTAADSAGSANARLKILNGTIASQLIRTMNDLTQAAYNVGTALLSSTTRGGLDHISEAAKKISEFSDPTRAFKGDKLGQYVATVSQGLTKGVGNLLGGPGLQLGITIILKLLEKLHRFIIDSTKDLTGIDSEAKKRALIETEITNILQSQSERYNDLISGQTTLNQFTKEYLNDLRASHSELTTIGLLAKSAAAIVAPSITTVPHQRTSAGGYTPDAEQLAARKENYTPGSTIRTMVRSGSRSIPVLANTRETRSTVIGADGLPYDFIHPPMGTGAWNRHRQRSIAATGIDPMNLRRQTLAAGGIPEIPTLPLNDFIEEVKDYFGARFAEDQHLYGRIVSAAQKSVTTGSFAKNYASGIPLVGNTGNKTFRQVLGGLFSAQRFPEIKTSDLDGFAARLTKTNIIGLRAEKVAAENTSLDPTDIQKVLARHGADFPLIAAYESSSDFTRPKNRETTHSLNVLGHNFNVPISILGDSRGIPIIEKARERLSGLSNEFGVKTPLKLPLRKAGAAFGTVYDEFLSNFFAERGVPVSDSTVEGRSNDENNPNAVLDILGHHPDISQFVGSNQKFAGADAKASVGEGIKSLAKKIFKTLAGDPYRNILKGPVTSTPPLTNVGKFNPSSKQTGILDSDVLGQGNDFNSLIYSAIATGKPLKVIHGPPGSGKTTRAKQSGGDFVKSRDDLDYFDQFILTTAAASEKNYKQGVFGLAFSAASNIESLFAHPDVLRQRLAKRDPFHDPNIKINESNLRNYANATEYLRKTYGPLGRLSEIKTSKGFVPNVPAVPAIREALSRENKATDGRAILASHPDLVSVRNPLGLAAIDRHQGTIENAIQQHKKFQSMAEIKNASTATGFVPNLATDNIGTSLALATVSYFSQLPIVGNNLSKLSQKFPILASQADIEAAKQKELIESYGQLRDGLLTGAIAQGKFNGELFKGAADVTRLESTFKDKIGRLAVSLDQYNKAAATQRSNTSQFGVKLAVGASLGGGIASSIGERFSPSIGAAIEDFSTGLSNAGQALIAFPNRIGKSLGAGLLTAGAASAFDTLVKGIENSRRTFELQQSAMQKLMAQVDTLASSLSSFDSLLQDSSVTQDTLNREYRKYLETLALIKQSPNGAKIATQIEGAPDNRARISRLAEFKSQESLRFEGLANEQLVKELAAKRSFGNIYSSGTFAVSSPFDKEAAQQTVLSIASSAIANSSAEFKEQLTGAVGSLEEFNSVIASNNNSLTRLLDNVQKTGKKEDRDILTQQIRSLLASQKINSDPRIVKAREELIAGNEARQQRLDDAIRKEQSTRRLFVNQGALQSSNILDIRGAATRGAGNLGLERVAGLQALSGLFQLKFGERTNREFSHAVELQRIDVERKQKVAGVSNQSSRNIVDLLTQSFDSTLKNAEAFKEIGNNQSQVSIGEFKTNLIEGLNRGITAVVSGGNLDRFQKGANFDFDALESAIAKSSGTNPGLQRQIQSYLSNNRSIELLKGIQNANLEVVNINQEALTEAERQREALEGFKKEVSFKELSSFLGGVRNLLDRNARRGTEREAVRSAFLLEHGTTAEARGIGGAGLLKFFKDQNIPIDLSGKNPLSQLMKRAFDAAAQGLVSVNQGSLGRINSAVGRFGGSGLVNGFATYSGIDKNKAAVASLQAEFKPEDAQVLSDSISANADSMGTFNKSLDTSIIAIQGFANAILSTKASLEAAIRNKENVRKQVTNEGNAEAEKFTRKQQTVSSAYLGALATPNIPERSNVAGSITSAIGLGVAGATGAGLLIRAIRKGRLPNPPSVAEGLAPRRRAGARDAYIDAKNSKNASAFDNARRAAQNEEAAATIAFAQSEQFGNIITPPNTFSLPAPNGVTARAKRILTLRNPSRTNVGTIAFNPALRYGYAEGTTVPVTPNLPPPLFIPQGQRPRDIRRAQYSAAAAAAAANPSGFSGTPTIITPPTPAQGRAAYLRGVAGRGAGFAGVVAGQLLASRIENPIASTAVALGSSYIPSVLSGAGIGTLLKGGGFGVGTGASLASGGAAGLLGAGALAAGTAYGGFKTGQYLNRFTTAGKLDIGLGAKESEFTVGVQNAILKMLKSGKSQTDIEKFVNTQINSTQGQLNDARGGFLTKIFGTNATGSGKSEAALVQTLEELKQLKISAAAAKENQDFQAKQEQMQEALLKVLDKLANPKEGETTSVNSSIKVEISLRDADKIPETLAVKLIEPLKKQFAELQGQVGDIASHVNIPPAPAKIG